MATAHVWPFGAVGTGRHYDSDPFYTSPVSAPGAVTVGSPVVGSIVFGPVGNVGPSDAGETEQSVYRAALHPAGPLVWTEPAPSRYPPPAEAELVTLWKKDRRVVMSITADGKTQDFYMPPARLVYLLREVAEQLAENTLIQ